MWKFPYCLLPTALCLPPTAYCLLPSAETGPPGDGFTNVAFTVRVTSDQPVVVGANFQFNGNIPSQCSLLPK